MSFLKPIKNSVNRYLEILPWLVIIWCVHLTEKLPNLPKLPYYPLDPSPFCMKKILFYQWLRRFQSVMEFTHRIGSFPGNSFFFLHSLCLFSNVKSVITTTKNNQPIILVIAVKLQSGLKWARGGGEKLAACALSCLYSPTSAYFVGDKFSELKIRR